MSELEKEHKRDELCRLHKKLQLQISGTQRGSAERYKLGQQISRIQQEINSLRPAKKAPGLDQYFIEAARRILSQTAFDAVMNAAVEDMEEDGRVPVGQSQTGRARPKTNSRIGELK